MSIVDVVAVEGRSKHLFVDVGGVPVTVKLDVGGENAFAVRAWVTEVPSQGMIGRFGASLDALKASVADDMVELGWPVNVRVHVVESMIDFKELVEEGVAA